MSSILTSPSRNLLNRGVLVFDEQATAGFSSSYDVRQYSAVRFVVSGTFSGLSLRLRRTMFGESQSDVTQGIYDAAMRPLTSLTGTITEPGEYIALIAGYETLAWRVVEIASGSVTVRAQMIAQPIPDIRPTSRIHELGRVLGHEVAASTNGLILDVQPLRYPFHFCTFHGGTSHAFAVHMLYLTGPPTAGGHSGTGSHIGNLTVFDETGTRGASPWMETMGNRLQVYIQNNDVSAHTYDLVLWGVG